MKYKTDKSVSLIQTKNINDWKPVLEGLIDVFGYTYYHAILSWCGVIDNLTPNDFWEVWAIKHNNIIIGICGLYSHNKNITDELWLGWLGIIPAYRNKRIGGLILNLLKQKCKEYKCCTLLSYVNKNGKPLNFYYRNGFSLKGTVANYIHDKPHLQSNFYEYFEDEEDLIISCSLK